MSGRGGKLLAGFVVLHVLCCGLPTLIAAAAFTGAGAPPGNAPLLAAAVLTVLAAVPLAVRGDDRPRTSWQLLRDSQPTSGKGGERPAWHA